MTGEQLIDDIEAAETPLEAVSALGKLSLRRMVAIPIGVGRDIAKIVMNGDVGEMIGASASHQ
jgi:hypothetical protein